MRQLNEKQIRKLNDYKKRGLQVQAVRKIPPKKSGYAKIDLNGGNMTARSKKEVIIKQFSQIKG